jgi:hypothetical protein
MERPGTAMSSCSISRARPSSTSARSGSRCSLRVRFDSPRQGRRSRPRVGAPNGLLDNFNNQGTLLGSAYGELADYFVKFIQSYQSNGVPIDAITPQSEPGNVTSYPGLDLPEPDEATFVSQYLQPALVRAALDPKIYGNDVSWDQLT